METHNALVDTLDRGDVAFGAAVETGSPMLVEVCGALGLDWVWIDFEHKNASPYDATYLEHLVRAAECADTELVVRLPNSEPALVRKVLDAGVRNVPVPRVTSPAEVRSVVSAARFEYDGEPGGRGLGFGRSSAYGDLVGDGTEPDRYDHQEDENTLVGILVEERAAMDDLEAILDVPEIGFVLPGPGDLSVQFGHAMDYDHPDVTAAVERIRDACIDRDIPVQGLYGSHFDGVEEMRAAVEDGYQLVGLGNEFGALREVVGSRLDALDED